MRKEPLARQIMRRDVVAVEAGASLWEIARLFSERGISGAPVVNGSGDLVGVISQTDIVRHLKELPLSAAEGLDFYAEPEPESRGLFGDSATARDLMSPDVIHASEETPVRTLSRMMLRRKIHRIIITRGRKISGIVTTMDVLRVL